MRFASLRSPIAFVVLAAALAFIGCATKGATPAAGTASAKAEIYDELNDFSKMEAHSADFDFDLKNPAAYPNGDASRIWPTSGDPQFFVYKLKDISSFSFVVGYYTYKHQDNPKLRTFNVFVSPDNKTWTEVAAKNEGADNGCWLFTTWTPAAEIPAGNNYIKFEFSDKDLHWSTEVSEVRVNGR
jgi:hypothetical protein